MTGTKYKLPSLLSTADRLIWVDCEMTGLGRSTTSAYIDNLLARALCKIESLLVKIYTW
jgi:hypothetical protein